MRCALSFAFSGASHWHRHAADKWARPAVTPYRFGGSISSRSHFGLFEHPTSNAKHPTSK
jgi:hypothetical protein